MADACGRAGCSGHYAADGYCDECGHKRPSGAAQSSQPASGTPTPRAAKAGKRKSKSPSQTGSTRAGIALGGTIATAASAATTGATTGATTTGSSSGRTTRTGTVPSGRSRTGGRGGLGANLVTIEPVPRRDPTTAVLANPSVPESQRFCSTCQSPVGRSRGGKPGLAEGFCPKDRTPFSFVPSLGPGELVDHRYEILGAIAHGGLGWIYLARDSNISDSGADRWVVLKGLINTGDADAMAAAVAERRFLVEVDHPSIVKIHDFAQHPDPKTGAMVGYIVMEYVGGRSLKELALSHLGPDGKRAPLPLDQVLAYGIEILPALGYLHDRGLLFCDFKPDNVIHAEELLKLIDLGAVRRINDQVSPLWGTPGYQAPELEREGASVASDLYTVGRALAVLSFDFGGFSSTFASSLPHPGDVPLLAEQESYHRLLLRATDPAPAQRFGSAAEFAEQATGVLREVLSAADGLARPAASGRFTPERRTFGALESTVDGPAVAAALPVALVDPADPAAGFLATLGGDDPAGTVATLESAPVSTVEVSLRLVRALVDAGRPADAAGTLKAISGLDGDWRLDWYTGLIALADGRAGDAVSAFDVVYSALPGEPAARLALAAACELSGDHDGAMRRYARVWRVDHAMVSAAFGLARMLLAAGDRADAVSILDEVPDVSSQYTAAQIAAVRATMDSTHETITEADLVAASARLEKLRLDAGRRTSLVVEMLQKALRWLTGSGPVAPVPRGTSSHVEAPAEAPAEAPGGLPRRIPWTDVIRSYLANRGAASTSDGSPRFLGEALREHDIRLGLERAYRTLASLEPDPQERYRLVDLANSVRPQTVL
jgi:serine/threonine-protein kinase PknG